MTRHHYGGFFQLARRFSALSLLFAGLCTGFPGPLHAEGKDLQQSAYKNSIAQESIRKDAEKIQSQLAALMSELKVNGLPEDTVILLSEAVGNLSELSSQDMQKVINSLQNASLSNEQRQQQQDLLNAYLGQKDISLKLKTLAGSLTSNQSRTVLPLLLQVLITRQSSNIRKTRPLESYSQPDSLNDTQKTQWSLVDAEQSSLVGEIDLLLKLAAQNKTTAPSGSNTGTETDRAQLKETAAQAAKFTNTGPFNTALAKQAALREALTRLLQKIQSELDVAERLEQIKSLLNKVESEQKELAEASKKSDTDKKKLAEQQAQVQDHAALAGDLLKSLNADAREQVMSAGQDMEKSAASLEKKTDQALAAQKDALTKLDKSRKLLDRQLADVRKQQSESPTQQMADLKQLQNDVNQTKPDDIKAVTDLAEKALAESPAAAEKLNNAADALQQPQPDAPKAAQELAQASTLLQQQMDALAQTAQAYQKLDQASQQLAQVQQQADKAQKSLQQSEKGNLAEASNQIMATQDGLSKVDTASLPADAKPDLQQAGQAMKDAFKQSAGGDKNSALTQTGKGKGSIELAQKKLAQAMATLQEAAAGDQPGNRQRQAKGKPDTHGKQQGDSSSVLTGHGVIGGPAQVVGVLSSKDRDAITQYQAEKIAPEYSDQVQQYFKNLANSTETR